MRGVLATSAVVLAACGGDSGSSPATSAPSNGGTLDDTSIDLTIDPNRTLVVSGTVGGTHAAASGSLHESGTATITGVLAGLGVLAHLTQQDEVPSADGYLSTTHLENRVGSAPSSLVGKFALNPDYSLRSGAISGAASGSSTAVGVDPVPDEASGSSVAINGMYGPTKVALTAGVPSGSPFTVAGTVDGRKVRFDVTPGHVAPGQGLPTLRVTGNYSGPADLLALDHRRHRLLRILTAALPGNVGCGRERCGPGRARPRPRPDLPGEARSPRLATTGTHVNGVAGTYAITCWRGVRVRV